MIPFASLLPVLAAAAPYVLAIGVNQGAGSELPPLRYADDDAAEAIRLFGGGPSRSWLHTVMDEESQRRLPELRSRARAPTRAELARSVAEIAARVEIDRGRGAEPVVVIWLSGHAARDQDGHTYFPLVGGQLTADALIEEVVAPLSPAHRVHLVVDTCFAASLVRSRAAVEPVSTAQAEQAFLERGLGAIPNAGVLLGSAAGARGFEWEEIRSGVFSAMVRAGLRGGADADGDDAVGYHELAAFLAAAAQGVVVAAARPSVRVWPPAVETQAPIAKRAWMGDVGVLDADLSTLGTVHVLDEFGGWILAGAFEPSFAPRLWLPRGRRLFLRARALDHPLIDEEGRFTVGPPLEREVRPRSLLGQALRQGLFTTPFGPAFYRGYVAGERPPDQPSATAVEPGTPVVPVGLVVLAVASGAAALATGAVAGEATWRYTQTDYERPSQQALEQMILFGSISTGAMVVAGALGVGAWWLWSQDDGRSLR